MVLALTVIAGCAGPVRAPFEAPQEERALPAAPSGLLASLEQRIQTQAGTPETIDNPRTSGFKLLDRSEEALRWRLTLIDAATRSIDTQYYLYHGDSTGLIFNSRR